MKSKYVEKIAAKHSHVISSPQVNGKVAVKVDVYAPEGRKRLTVGTFNTLADASEKINSVVEQWYSQLIVGSYNCQVIVENKTVKMVDYEPGMSLQDIKEDVLESYPRATEIILTLKL